MNEHPNFGPYSKWQSVSAFSSLSEKAFALFDNLIHQNWSLLKRPIHHLFLRMAYQAKTTSLAIRINNSWALSLPAFALTRVRLEQTIICSYLIYEEDSIGLGSFLMYMPIGNFKATRVVMDDSVLAEALSHVDLSSMEDEAVKSQQHFKPGFLPDEDKFERNWTKLDIRSIAKKRDVLASASSSMLKQCLEREYITIYKEASSVIHADCASLSYSFLDIFQAPSGQPVLMAVPSWATIVSAKTAQYDILQCYEILNWLEISANDEYLSLMDEWIKFRDEDVSRSKK